MVWETKQSRERSDEDMPYLIEMYDERDDGLYWRVALVVDTEEQAEDFVENAADNASYTLRYRKVSWRYAEEIDTVENMEWHRISDTHAADDIAAGDVQEATDSDSEDAAEDGWECDYCGAVFETYEEAAAHASICEKQSSDVDEECGNGEDDDDWDDDEEENEDYCDGDAGTSL